MMRRPRAVGILMMLAATLASTGARAQATEPESTTVAQQISDLGGQVEGMTERS